MKGAEQKRMKRLHRCMKAFLLLLIITLSFSITVDQPLWALTVNEAVSASGAGSAGGYLIGRVLFRSGDANVPYNLKTIIKASASMSSMRNKDFNIYRFSPISGWSDITGSKPVYGVPDPAIGLDEIVVGMLPDNPGWPDESSGAAADLTAWEQAALETDRYLLYVPIDARRITYVSSVDVTDDVFSANQSTGFHRSFSVVNTGNNALSKAGDRLMLTSPMPTIGDIEIVEVQLYKKDSTSPETDTYTFPIVVEFVDYKPTYGISLDPADKIDFGKALLPYLEDLSKTLKVTNNGSKNQEDQQPQPTGNLTVTLGGADASNFMVSTKHIHSLDVGEEYSFTVEPKMGLPARLHTATLSVSGANGINETLDLVFSVEDVPYYGITLYPSGDKDFGSVMERYGDVTPHAVTINNAGNRPTGYLSIGLSGGNASDFELSATSVTDIAVNASAGFTVKPKTALALGSYSATVTVSGGNGISESFSVSLQVTDYIATDKYDAGIKGERDSAKQYDGKDTFKVAFLAKTRDGKKIGGNQLMTFAYRTDVFELLYGEPLHPVSLNAAEFIAVETTGGHLVSGWNAETWAKLSGDSALAYVSMQPIWSDAPAELPVNPGNPDGLTEIQTLRLGLKAPYTWSSTLPADAFRLITAEETTFLSGIHCVIMINDGYVGYNYGVPGGNDSLLGTDGPFIPNVSISGF